MVGAIYWFVYLRNGDDVPGSAINHLKRHLTYRRQ